MIHFAITKRNLVSAIQALPILALDSLHATDIILSRIRFPFLTLNTLNIIKNALPMFCTSLCLAEASEQQMQNGIPDAYALYLQIEASPNDPGNSLKIGLQFLAHGLQQDCLQALQWELQMGAMY